MPGRDGTGPCGLGPGTGRGMGPCGTGIAAHPFAGCGRGRGNRWQYYASGKPGWMRYSNPMNTDAPEGTNPVQEKMILEQQIKNVELHLDQLKEQMKKYDK